jgi:hypothetical protein
LFAVAGAEGVVHGRAVVILPVHANAVKNVPVAGGAR